MKRIIKNPIFTFIVSIIITSGVVGALAYSYQANDISYTTSHNSNVQNVEQAINDLYSKTSKVKIGDIVYMVPTSIFYTITPSMTGMDSYSGSASPASTIKKNGQAIKPNRMKYWRVININSDGTIEAVSEYAQQDTSGNNIYFNGAAGYQKFVGTLNTIAKQYANSNYTVEGGFRHFGYNGQTEYVATAPSNASTPTYQTPTPTPTPTIGGDLGQEYENGYYGDTLYSRDVQLLWNARKKKDASITLSDALKVYQIDTSGNPTTTFTKYWLASRRYLFDSASIYSWSGRYVHANGGIYDNGLFNMNGAYSNYYAIRPVITLKSGLTYTEATSDKYADWIVS